MRLNTMRVVAFTTLMMAASFIFLPPAGATLIGDTITATGSGLSPAYATISPWMIEFVGIRDSLYFDFAGHRSLIIMRRVSPAGGG